MAGPRIPGRNSSEVKVGVAGGKVKHGLEGVGGQPVAAVVGHVGHVHGDRICQQTLEQLATLGQKVFCPKL